MTSRRGFILQGAAAWAAFLSGRAFAAAPGAFDGVNRRLRVGVLSDTHISVFDPDAQDEIGGYNAKTFIRALRWFDEQKVDAVVISGDLTNHAFEEEFMAVGDAWRRVFPGGKGAGGRTVQKLFICGNHDWEGWKYGKFGVKKCPDAAELKRRIFTYNREDFWRKAFDEDFTEYPAIEVNGYMFVGAHWPHHKDPGAAQAIEACAAKAGGKPFFFLQHPHVRGSVFGGAEASEEDAGATLAKYPNAVAISGHSHLSITDERSIWQGAYTAVNAGCLRYIALPSGRENSGPKRNSAFKAMPYNKVFDCRQGMLMDVYGDRIVFARREFVTGEPLGPDWVVPLAGERPMRYAPRAAASKPPKFPSDAKVKVSPPAPGKTRGGGSVEQVTIEFPQALRSGKDNGRVFEYRVELKFGNNRYLSGETIAVRRFMADGFCKPESQVPETMTCVMNATEIPRETDLSFEVKALNCFGVASEPIGSGSVRFKGVVVRW